MKKLTVVLFALLLTCAGLAAQQPPARGGGQGAPGGGGRGGAQPAPAPAAMLDIANKLAEAINKQDAATLTKMVAPDAVYLDEDGHAPPVASWITKLTTGTPPKKIVISATHGQVFDNAGWVSFNYTLTEDFKGSTLNAKGIASIVVKKAAGGDWQIALIHGALEQHIAGLTQ